MERRGAGEQGRWQEPDAMGGAGCSHFFGRIFFGMVLRAAHASGSHVSSSSPYPTQRTRYSRFRFRTRAATMRSAACVSSVASTAAPSSAGLAGADAGAGAGAGANAAGALRHCALRLISGCGDGAVSD